MRKEFLDDLSDSETLRITINNDNPILLDDLINSFAAFSEQYERFNERVHGSNALQAARLYIRSIREGSIITDLVGMAEQLGILDNPREALAPFAAHLNDAFQYLTSLSLNRPELSKKDLKDIDKIAEIIAKDPQSTINLTVYNGPVQINTYTYNSQDMNAAQNNIRREMSRSPLPDADIYEKELFYWWQARGDLRAKAGDKGKIERFSDRPVKVIFPSEEVKAQLLDTDSNPFKLVFVVDVQVERIGNQVAAYKVFKVYESFDPHE